MDLGKNLKTLTSFHKLKKKKPCHQPRYGQNVPKYIKGQVTANSMHNGRNLRVFL